MHRNHLHGSSEIIEKALSYYPKPIQELLRGSRACHIATGVDPNFVGLHSYGVTEGQGDFSGRSFSETAHVLYPFHDSQTDVAVPVMILPVQFSVITVVHEFAHVLDFLADFPENPKNFTAVNDYAALDDWEKWAEAVSLRLAPDAFKAQEEAWNKDGRYWDNTADLNRDDVAFIDSILDRLALL